MTGHRTFRKGIFYLIVLGVFLSVSLGGIVSQLLLGSQTRLTGDDYCYNAVLAQEGFWGMQSRSYLEVSMYNGNRYSLTLFSGILGLFPALGTPVIIIFSVLGWLAGLVLLLRKISNHYHLELTQLECLLIAASFVCLILWSAPHPDQSLFWRSGMLPYFMPLVGGTWLIVLFLSFIAKQKYRWYTAGLLFLLAILVAGFSETGAMVQLGLWGLMLTYSLIALVPGKRLSYKKILMIVMILAGTLVAFALMYYSPSTALRRDRMNEPLALGPLLSLLGLNLKVVLYQALMRRTIHLVIPMLFGFGLGLILYNRTRQELKVPSRGYWKSLVLYGLGISISAILLILCVLLPATYIFSDYPPERALILSQAILTAAEMMGGIWLAYLMMSLFYVIPSVSKSTSKVQIAVGLLFLMSVFYAPVSLIQTGVNRWPLFSKWARFWDVRHQVLLDAGEQNVRVVHVDELDSLIKDIAELSPNPDYWYNNCAEMYYGVNAIYADQPGWDE